MPRRGEGHGRNAKDQRTFPSARGVQREGHFLSPSSAPKYSDILFLEPFPAFLDFKFKS